MLASQSEEAVRLRAYYRFLANRARDARGMGPLSTTGSWPRPNSPPTRRSNLSLHAHVVAGHGAGGHAEAEHGNRETEQPESRAHAVAGHGAAAATPPRYDCRR